MVWPYAAAIGVSAVGSYLSGRSQAKSMGEMAEAERAEARRTQKMAMEAAEPSYSELSAISRLVETRSRAMQLMEKNIANEERLLAAVDPALREAGQQAYELLRGKEAPVLDPIRKQRERSRTNLENTLASQLGSGWATSSAGMQALNDFDMQTDSLMSTAQQQTIGTLLGVSASVRPDVMGKTATMAQTIGGLTEAEIAAEQNIAQRKVSAITQTAPAMIKTAGAQYAGDVYKKQMQQQLFGDVMQMGGQYMGYKMGQAPRKKEPSRSPATMGDQGIFG